MYRILVFGMTENPGGVESFLMNYYRHINRELIQFDFLCNTYHNVAFEDEITSYGGRVFHITARSDDYFRFHKELDSVFKDHAGEWNAVWVNVCSLANIDYLKIARKYGIQRRIIHSHNSQNMDSKLRGFLHAYNKKRIASFATDFWACSESAAEWFFCGDELEKAAIIHNAIDCNAYRFSEEKRKQLRNYYNWNDKFVIGNIGRLHFQKNQAFAIQVFSEYYKNHEDSVLVLVGQGEDEEELRAQAMQLGISENVFFAGVQQDIQAWLSCFDLFLFPSLFEGLSLVLLEAQANGISILAAENGISKENKLNEDFSFLSINEGVTDWANKISEMRNNPRIPYLKAGKSFQDCGYEISSEAEKIENCFLNSSFTF